MKSWKLICTLVLALAMLCALPALAEETPEQLPSEPEQTTDAVCEADQGAHEVAEWTTTKEATCVDAGSRQGLCSKCGKIYVETISATGNHSYTVLVTEEKPATCTEDGATAVYKCETCDATTGGDVIPATGEHVVTTWELVTKATCTTEGEETGVCDVCGETQTRAIPIDPTAHVYDEGVETPATCESDGQIVYTCTLNPEHTETVTIPATGHTVTTWVLETKATCSTEGSESGVCDVCGETQTRAIPVDPEAHIFDEGVETPATCEKDGQVLYTCTLNPEHTQTVVIPATGHTWDEGKVTTKPTCTEEGVRTYTCTVCGATRTEAIEANGHSWSAWKTTKEATEEEDGTQERTCSVCGEKQTRTVAYEGTMPETGVFTLPTALLVSLLALSVAGYAVLKRKSVRG